MARRTAPQRDTDDLAFPIRVKVMVPPTGLGTELNRALVWLKENLPPGDYAQHGAGTLGGDTVGFHFRRIEDAAAFLAAFPRLELADTTTSRGYRSPLFPHGRAPS